jgi:phosphoribosylamine--glycine ligase
MRVLIVGSGGREHALAWKVASSARVARVFVAPGNAGTQQEAKCENVAVAADDLRRLRALAERERIDLTIVGPEAPLVLGIVDEFTAAGLRCFGPTRACARLEGSKAFSKDFLERHGIPTARYARFTRASFDPAFVRRQRLPVVVKADGLAAGKGVVIAATHAEALATIEGMFAGAFGAAGNTVVVEEVLAGEETSGIVMVDGTHALPLATSQDHKRLGDGDTGPNTGGMGAISPAPLVTPALHSRIMPTPRSSTLRSP